MRAEKLNKKREFSRKQRVRKKIASTSLRPRLTVFRSNKHVYAQIIDDQKGITLVSASEKDTKAEGKKRIEVAQELGKIIAEKAKAKKIKEVVFDKGSYKYHGRVRALAEGAREGGLSF